MPRMDRQLNNNLAQMMLEQELQQQFLRENLDRNKSGVYDDTKTEGQRARDRNVREEGIIYPNTPTVNPYHYNNQPGQVDEEVMTPPNRSGGRMSMQQYEVPMQLPKYPMQVVPPDALGQLQEFYSGQGVGEGE